MLTLYIRDTKLGLKFFYLKVSFLFFIFYLFFFSELRVRVRMILQSHCHISVILENIVIVMVI